MGREDQVPGQKDQNWLLLVSGFAQPKVIGDHVVGKICPAQQQGSLSRDPAQQGMLIKAVNGLVVEEVANLQSTSSASSLILKSDR